MADVSESRTDDEPSRRVSQIAAETLFAGRRVVEIVHQGEVYRLMITRNNKLILQK